jgi:hypothetical protein
VDNQRLGVVVGGGVMSERLVYQDTDKRIYVVQEATDDTPRVERYEWAPGREPAEERLAALETELRGMRERVAAVEVVSAEALALRDAIKPQTAKP